jgi:hypothetical protein
MLEEKCALWGHEQSCDIILKWISYRLNEEVEAAFS